MNSGDRVRALSAAFLAKDRAAAEELLHEDFHFTSPQDDHIDRAAWFERCWPNSDQLRSIDIEKLFVEGDEVFVRYRAVRTADGVAFRNAEFVRLESGKILEVQVYFGADE